jgi:hypothetical protein
MKTKIATLLAISMIVAVGLLNATHTDAKAAKDSSPAPALTAEAALGSAAVPQATTFNFEKNHGKIKRLYPTTDGVYFSFGMNAAESQTAMNPTNGYYFIAVNHPNYNALVDLLYLAAQNRWNLQARTQPTLGTGGRADVIYLVQDF